MVETFQVRRYVSVRRHFTTEFIWEVWWDGKVIQSGYENSAQKARKEGELYLRGRKRKEKGE